MKIIDYIKGDKRGRASNELEREALKDPFLADAIEGLETFKHENHFDRLLKMHRHIARRSQKNKHHTLYRTIRSITAAAALVAIGFGVWTLMPSHKTDQAVMHDALIANLQDSTTPIGETEQLLAEAFVQSIHDYIQESAPADIHSDISIEGEQNEVIENLDTIANPNFIDYFNASRKVVGVSGNIIVEFRVGDSGRPSKIQVLSAPTKEAGREAIDLLVSGPDWQPTAENRIRTILVVND